MVIQTVLPTVKKSTWYVFSENILQTLLSSKEIAERKFAIQKILELRDGNDIGDLSVRPRKTPTINTDAITLLDLIEWTSDVFEPPLTCKLTVVEIKEFIEKPMEVPDWSSIERIVKQVTEASMAVYTFENVGHTSEINKLTVK